MSTARGAPCSKLASEQPIRRSMSRWFPLSRRPLHPTSSHESQSEVWGSLSPHTAGTTSRGIRLDRAPDAEHCFAHGHHPASQCGLIRSRRSCNQQSIMGPNRSAWVAACRASSIGGDEPIRQPAVSVVQRRGPKPVHVGKAAQGLHPQYDELLRKALSQAPDALVEFAAEHRDELTMSFMLWLADREAEAEGADAEALGAVAGQLTAVREGLRPVGPDVLEAAAVRLADDADACSAAERRRDSGAVIEGLTPAESAALARRTAALAFAPPSLAATEQRIAELGTGLRDMRLQSSVSLIGRQRVDAADAAQVDVAMSAASATGRILDVLLEEADREVRSAMLADAFTPPEAGSSAGNEGGVDEQDLPGEEQLFTSPLRLLLAIDGELSIIPRTADGAQGVRSAQRFFNSGDALAPAERQRRLQELREDVQRSWEDQSARAERDQI